MTSMIKYLIQIFILHTRLYRLNKKIKTNLITSVIKHFLLQIFILRTLLIEWKK